MAMAKKREIFKVDEDALKDMMASESISCGKSGTDVGENVLPVTEKEKNVPDVKTQGQEKSRKTIRADPGLEEKVEMYKELFLDRKKSVHRKQTYISYDMYRAWRAVSPKNPKNILKMMWIVLTVAVLVCGLLLCCVYVLSNKICSLKRQVRELNEKIGIANCFPEYSRVYLNDAPVGKGRQIRIRCGLYNKASRLIPFMAPGMSVSVYVSNIVEEHLKRHGELLKNELECFLYKDSLWKN